MHKSYTETLCGIRDRPQNSTLTYKKTMTKKVTPKTNSANQQNANKGTNGQNKQYSQVHGNRGKQLNPNQKGKK
jgi:hypothetical protein